MSDVFVKLAGIRGTGTGRSHQGWVTALHFDLGGMASRDGGKVHGFEPSFTKLRDSSSAQIVSHAMKCSKFPTVIIEVESTGVVFLRVELSDAQIAGYSSPSGDASTETFALNATGVKWSTVGGKGGRDEWVEYSQGERK